MSARDGRRVVFPYDSVEVAKQLLARSTGLNFGRVVGCFGVVNKVGQLSFDGFIYLFVYS